MIFGIGMHVHGEANIWRLTQHAIHVSQTSISGVGFVHMPSWPGCLEHHPDPAAPPAPRPDVGTSDSEPDEMEERRRQAPWN